LIKDLISIRNGEGMTALHIASQRNHVEIQEILLLHCRDDEERKRLLESKDNRQLTPFLLAISSCAFEACDFLVSRNANIEALDNEGRNCLML